MGMVDTIIDDEVLMIENGGEMPEVILHGCLYFLGMDPEGPQLALTQQNIRRLKLAVIDGYRSIILRDLTVANRGKSHYRGLARTLVNVQRLRRFCEQEEFDMGPVRVEVGEWLQNFMVAEYSDVSTQARKTCINCSLVDLAQLFALIAFDASRLPAGWQRIVCTGSV
jgi:hypothetical protein